MPKLTAEPDEILVDSLDDADRLLREIDDYGREYATQRRAMEREVADVIRKYKDKMQRRKDAVARRVSKLTQFAKSNRNLIIGDTDGKSYSIPGVDSKIRFYSSGATVTWKSSDEDAIIEELEDMGREELIVKKLQKTPLKKAKDFREVCDSVPGLTYVLEREGVKVDAPDTSGVTIKAL